MTTRFTEIANINHNIGGTGSYADIDSVDIKVTANDNDVVAGAAIRVDQRSVTLTEGDEGEDAGSDESAEVMVRLAVVPTGPVTVTVATEAGVTAATERRAHVYGCELG